MRRPRVPARGSFEFTPHVPPRPRRAARRRLALERLEDRSLLAADFDVLVFSRTAGFRHDSIAAGIAAIEALGAANDFTVEATEAAADFNDEHLAKFEAVVFLNTTGDVLNSGQQAAFERYIRAGGGFVGVHAAADTEYNWAWYGQLVGAYFDSHPAIQQATIVVADQAHPSTAHLPDRWVRTDEWYNYRANPRGDVHVLATLDEDTYSGGGMGFDHPIAWTHAFDGGRAWYTGLGHTTASYAEPEFRQHLLGGIQSVAGFLVADDGATVNDNFQKVVLDANTVDPMELDVAPDGRVFYAQRGGAVKVYLPELASTQTVITLPVYTGDEDGLLGLALDPDFDQNSWIYLFYSPTGSTAEQRVSRFTVANNRINRNTEEIVLRIPVQRSGVNHSGGSLAFGPDGTLYISTGDNTNPFESSGYNPIDERPNRQKFDAQRSSANPADLRGKILRIKPVADGSYTIPEGNLFPADGSQGRPEIYVMGNRNPFRISVDSETGWLYWGEVGPDAQNNSASRGPRGYDEFNQARAPGNYGWPHFVGNNLAYREFDFATGESGPAFDPAAPENDSPNNTGSQSLPAAQPAWIWYPYGTSAQFPELGAGGRTAMAGPVYHYDPDLASTRKLPAYYDDTLFVYEWSRNWILEVKLDAAGQVLKINPFLPSPSFQFRRPMDMQIGPDGAMYLLEWGSGFGGGNGDSQLVRIDYNSRFQQPVAVGLATPSSGAAPLTVQFSGDQSSPGTFGPLTYAWDFNNDGVVDSTAANPSHVYTTRGDFLARLTVTDQVGTTAQTTVPITSGNTAPVVTIHRPFEGEFFTWGQPLPFDVSVVDAEDGGSQTLGIDPHAIVVQPYVGHDEHSHPLSEYAGPAGTLPAPEGHGGDGDNLFLLVEARYTDAGAPGVSPLTGRGLVRLQPRLKQAEHLNLSSGLIVADTDDPQGGGDDVQGFSDASYLSLAPVNLLNIDTITYRAGRIGAGVRIEVRLDSPQGELLSSQELPNLGSYTSVAASLGRAVQGTHELFFVVRGPQAALANLRLNRIEFGRAGNTAPQAVANEFQALPGAALHVAAGGVLGNDSDPQTDALFASLVQGPAHGVLELRPDGGFRYLPAAGFFGRDTFTYLAHDGVFPSAAATVTLAVLAPGDANRDGRVDLSDFGALKAGFGLPGRTWETGDFDHNGDADLTDFGLLKQHFGLGLALRAAGEDAARRTAFAVWDD